MASARDIVAAGNPPRAVFLDYPLGHTTGRPFAPQEQYAITRAGLEALASIDKPGTVVALERRWDADDAWKADAMNPAAGDLRQPRDTTPRYQCAADRVAAEGAPQRPDR